MLHFDSSRFLDDGDDSFVSIDLNDDDEECDICHQCTDEQIVHVVLSDEFLRFEGSRDRQGGVARAHQICLEKWSEIIERNLKFNKDSENNTSSPRSNSPVLGNGETVYKEVRHSLEKEVENTLVNKNLKLNSQKDIANEDCDKERKISLQQLSSLSIQELSQMVSTLELNVRDISNDLISELQTRDKLNLEVSGQNSMIAQLVKMENNQSKKLTLRCAQLKRQPASKMTILV